MKKICRRLFIVGAILFVAAGIYFSVKEPAILYSRIAGGCFLTSGILFFASTNCLKKGKKQSGDC